MVWVVVSDDGYVRRNAAGLGARVMPATEFWNTLNRPPKRHRVASADPDDERPLSPSEELAITEALKKEWGVE